MKIDKSLTDRVDAEVARCVALAKAKWPQHEFKTPRVMYDLRGRVAGTASSRANHVRLNAVLLKENPDEMVGNTVPHEVAHLVDAIAHPETRARTFQFTSRGPKMSARSVHGPTWKAVMRLFGVEPSRTHNMDTTNASTRRSVRHLYVCPQCNYQVQVGPKHHKAMQQRGAVLTLKKCRHQIGKMHHRGLWQPPKKKPQLIIAVPKWVDTVSAPLPVPDFSKTKVYESGDPRLGRLGTLGRLACELIVAGTSDDEVLVQVLKAFPAAKTTRKCIAWYKNKLKKIFPDLFTS